MLPNRVFNLFLNIPIWNVPEYPGDPGYKLLATLRNAHGPKKDYLQLCVFLFSINEALLLIASNFRPKRFNGPTR